jgi:hypothetical protein
VIGRRSVSKGREYVRVWVYVPTKVSEDTAFPFKVGDPCEVEIDTQRGLVVRPLSVKEASLRGWARRERYRKVGAR